MACGADGSNMIRSHVHTICKKQLCVLLFVVVALKACVPLSRAHRTFDHEFMNSPAELTSNDCSLYV